MNKYLTVKTVPIIESGKVGYTNYYISPETIKNHNFEEDLYNTPLIYEDIEHHQRIVGFFSPESPFVIKEKDDGTVCVEGKVSIFHKLESTFLSLMRSGEVNYTPEIELVKVNSKEDGTNEIEEFGINNILAYDPIFN